MTFDVLHVMSVRACVVDVNLNQTHKYAWPMHGLISGW